MAHGDDFTFYFQATLRLGGGEQAAAANETEAARLQFLLILFKFAETFLFIF